MFEMTLSPKAQEALAVVLNKHKATLTPQELFLACASVDTENKRKPIRERLTAIKPIIRELIDEEAIYFTPSTGLYTIYDVTPETIGDIIHEATKGQYIARWGEENTAHAKAGNILASAVWSVDTERLEIAETRLGAGLVFCKGAWCPIDSDAELKARAEQQLQAVKQLKELYEARTSWSYDVFSDFRGRFYYRGKLITPQSGELMKWLLVCIQEDEVMPDLVEVDHRSSFAQIESILSGQRRLGLLCGIGTTEETDFYSAIAKQAGYNELTKEQREAVKRATMPKAYGAGEKVLKPNFLAHWNDEDAYKEIQKHTQALDFVKRACQAWASREGRANRQTEWTTPSGFHAKQRYWIKNDVSWNSHDDSEMYYPKSFTITEYTNRVCIDSFEGAEFGGESVKECKSAVVAQTANLVQSLDASLLALTTVKFFERTGIAPWAIHDAYIIPREHVQDLVVCMKEAFKDMIHSEEMTAIKAQLQLTKVLPFSTGSNNMMDTEEL